MSFSTKQFSCLSQIRMHRFLSTYFKLTQFSYTEIGNIPDGFMSLNEIHNFLTSCRFYVFE